MRKRLYWRVCCAVAVLLSALTFTPLVMPVGRYAPLLAGMPRTLWAGILVAFALVALTFIGARVHPINEADKRGNRWPGGSGS